MLQLGYEDTLQISQPSLSPPELLSMTYPESTFRLDVHDSQDCLVQNGIAHVFACFCVGGHLEFRGDMV